MRALVTGAEGFLGTHLVTYLESCGDVVIPTLRERVDVRDLPGLADVVEEAKPDVVFHLAAQSSVARSFQDPLGTFSDNVTGTASLLEAVRLRAPHARVVLASSAEVYGVPGADDLPLLESLPVRPASPYAASKAAAEIVAAQYARAYGIESVAFRGFNMIGPGQSTAFALPAFASQIAAIARGECAPVLRVGNLEAERDMTDVRDAVRALHLLACVPESEPLYNLCSGRGTRLRQALESLIEVSGLEVVIERDEQRFRPIDVPSLVGSAALLRMSTGWQPSLPLQQTIRDIYREHLEGAPVEAHGEFPDAAE